MSEHTQSKLTATPGVVYFEKRGELSTGYIVTDDKGRWVAFVLGEDGISIPEAEANAKRMAACWNACEGISTKALQNVQPGDIAGWGSVNVMMPKVMAENAELKRQVAELRRQLDAHDAEIEAWGGQMERKLSRFHDDAPLTYLVGFSVGQWWADRPWRKDRPEGGAR